MTMAPVLDGSTNDSMVRRVKAGRFLSILYRIGVEARLKAYRKEIFRSRSLPAFVLSVGNLSVGGTGKTPAVAAIAQWAFEEGYRVCILSRGYKGRYKTPVLEVSDGFQLKAGPRESGDEPYLLAKRLAGVPVVVSRKRYVGGMFAREHYGSDFFILDDGFQHLELARDLNLVLMDGLRPFGNGHVLPAGPLREPVRGLNRADAFLLTRCEQGGQVERTRAHLKERFGEKPVYVSNHVPEKVVFPASGEFFDPADLKGKRVLAFAGIARPEVFEKELIALGAEPVIFKALKDHHQFEERELVALIRAAGERNLDCVLTTEKDWVRLEGMRPSYPFLGYLSVRLSIMDDREVFFDMIRGKVRGRKASGPRPHF